MIFNSIFDANSCSSFKVSYKNEWRAIQSVSSCYIWYPHRIVANFMRKTEKNTQERSSYMYYRACIKLLYSLWSIISPNFRWKLQTYTQPTDNFCDTITGCSKITCRKVRGLKNQTSKVHMHTCRVSQDTGSHQTVTTTWILYQSTELFHKVPRQLQWDWSNLLPALTCLGLDFAFLGTTPTMGYYSAYFSPYVYCYRKGYTTPT